MPRSKHALILATVVALLPFLVIACTRDPLNGEPDPTGPEGPVGPIPEDGFGPPDAILPPLSTPPIGGDDKDALAACGEPVSVAFADQHVGQRVGIAGQVVGIEEMNDRIVLELGLAPVQGGADASAVSLLVLIPTAVLDRFVEPPQEAFEDEFVCVAGVIQEVEDDLYIVVSNPNAIITIQ